MSGRGPRRDLSKERFWRRVVQQQSAGRLSVREVCEQRGLAESAFYAWRREIRRRDQLEVQDTANAQRRQSTVMAGASAHSAGPSRKRGRPAQPRFLPVSVANVAPPAAVEIRLPSGIVLRIGHDCDLLALRAVLGAVLDGQAEVTAC
jgi:Transposase